MASDQATFARALLDPERPLPPGVTSHTHEAPAKRFAVYRNNVVTSLIDALAARFPVTLRIVGEEFFRAMAGLFARAHPPRSPLMMQYGDDLPDFIADFAPAAELPYLADVARLEAARTRAFHAADASPLPAAAFAEIPPAALAALRVMLCPGTAILRSAHPVVTIWAMNADGGEPAPIEHWVAEDALVSREGFEVAVRRLPPGGAVFLEALGKGATLGEAAAGAMDETAEFDLTANLAGLIGAGLVAEIIRAKDKPECAAIEQESRSDSFLVRLLRFVIGWLDRIPYAVLALAARVFPAAVFWQSGQTKVNGFALADSTIPLFEYEYKLPLISPVIAAYSSAIAEHVFPFLLVIGLASRLSAFALFFMTMVIEIFVFPDAWPTHGTWIAGFLLIMARGPGVLSLDHLIASHYGLAKRGGSPGA